MRSVRQEITLKPSMIIAPHPDDEVLACGGLIIKKKANKVRVSVVYFTDGESAHSGCCNTAPEKIGLARRTLAVEAGGVLGLAAEDIYWMGLSDGKIPRKNDRDFKKAVVRLSKLIEEIRPQEIFSPHYLDCWPDHEAASEIVSSALKVSDYRCELFYYPVWMWHNLHFKLLPEILKSTIFRIDITPFLGRKKMALANYLSALNPECGKPFCGNLPDGFVDHFQNNYEILFRAKNN